MTNEADPTPDADRVRRGEVERPDDPGARTVIGTIAAIVGAIMATLFLLNPGAGFFAEIPDNFPIVGNLDEATATMILVTCLGYLGLRLPFLRRSTKTRERD